MLSKTDTKCWVIPGTKRYHRHKGCTQIHHPEKLEEHDSPPEGLTECHYCNKQFLG